jgi:hypothetical protein
MAGNDQVLNTDIVASQTDFDTMPEMTLLDAISFGDKRALAAYERRFGGQADKAIRPELKRPASHGVPSGLEVARALSRLEILPNPPDPQLEDPTKYVESPWTIVPTFTIDPNAWDDAVLATVNLEDLVATDPFLNRKKVRKHIEAMGQALTPHRHYAMVIVRGGEYTIIDGHHRLMSQWLLGQATAAAWVLTLKGSN